ncbi:hypothetical protein VP1G_10526 [Cytospora mali]|uniref:Uncharacterized protein n=1 Tax=Cytospora mali TaxID=578113 RepID=A0A194UNE7_CYTMA|nr:hypothetical protein VP1G_10526 [Valsa mali var. pyri (nom. inval.)]
MLGVCPVIPQTPQTNHNFVLLCVPFMQRAVKLHQAEVCRINPEQEFFRVLRYYYASQRGFRSWARLRKVRSIDFVKFEMYKSQLVDIQTSPSIPPETRTQDYTYDPLPAESNPPIGTNLLMHLFEHPDHAECEPVLYKKVPKKLDYRLEACPVKKTAIGWGVSFVEGLNWFTVFIYGCAGFASALVLAVVWSMIRGDIQGGFAIAGFMLAFIGFCMGIARIEIEMT